MATAIAPSVQGLKQVAWLDCPGGGQVSVDGTTAYIAHMKGILGKSPRVGYTPNSATGDEMRLSEMTMATDRTDRS